MISRILPITLAARMERTLEVNHKSPCHYTRRSRALQLLTEDKS